jgi:hypothetical protein
VTTTATATRATFPTCDVHGVAIVRNFPVDCPLGKPNPLTALHQLTIKAFDIGLSDPHVSSSLHRLADTCSSCIDANLNHPHVQYLRSKKRGAA